jgi:hypothetical protein
MPSIVIVEKNGDLKDQEYKSSTTDELYKKCSLKKADGFGKVAEWTYSKKGENMITVELWARNNGQANQENKYDFPPPADNDLFFGNCALLARDSNMSIVNLTVEKWNNVYEHLFGGFETLADNEDDDDEEEDELDNVPSIMKTKDGYLKDGFIIEDVLEDGASDSDDDDEEGVDDVENSDHDDNGDEKYESSSTDDDGGGGSDDSSELTSEEYDYSDSDSGSGSDSGSDPNPDPTI